MPLEGLGPAGAGLGPVRAGTGACVGGGAGAEGPVPMLLFVGYVWVLGVFFVVLVVGVVRLFVVILPGF